MHEIFSFLKVLTICTAALIALVLVLVVVVSNMRDNPLKEFLSALTRRLGVTAGLTVMSIPINAAFDEIGIGELYDIGLVIFLCFYWFNFFKKLYNSTNSTVDRSTTSVTIKGSRMS
jgi:hypothetical protein